MKIKNARLLPLILLAVLSNARAENEPHYTLIAFADKIQDLQPVVNCIEYSFCNQSHSKVWYNSEQYVLSAELKLGTNAIAKMISDCHLYEKKARITVQDERGHELSQTSLSLLSTQKSHLPAVLEVTEAEGTRFKAVTPKIAYLIKYNDYQPAIDEVIANLQMDLRGYQVKYVPESTFAGAVTDHEKREVQLSKGMLQNLHPCELARILRHESEHIHQMAYVNGCKLAGARVALADHDHRELSAHLNDALNLEIYCEDRTWMKSSSTFYVKRALQYVKRVK